MSIVAVEKRTVAVPEGVTVSATEAGDVTVKGPNGEQSRRLYHPQIQITVEDGEVVIEADLVRRRTAALVGTFAGHITNMVKGAENDFEAQLKIVHSHFPIKARAEDDVVLIENFLGEKAARRARILDDCEVKIKGSDVTVTGRNKEHVGQTAANIEYATRIKGYDPRVFQDGIYIVKKP